MFFLRKASHVSTDAQSGITAASALTAKETQAIDNDFAITKQKFMVCKLINVSFVVQDVLFDRQPMEYLHKNPIWCIVAKSDSAEGFWKVTCEDFTYSLDFPIRVSGLNPLTEVNIRLNFDCPINRADIQQCVGVFEGLDEAIELLTWQIREDGSERKNMGVRENERMSLAAKLGVNPDDCMERKIVLSPLRRPVKHNPAWGPSLETPALKI